MAEAEDILRQVYASEVDYAEARNRRDALLALPLRNAEEDQELASVQAQITHDETVIGVWLARVATVRGRTAVQVRAALDSPVNRAIRDAALDAVAFQLATIAKATEDQRAEVLNFSTDHEHQRRAFLAASIIAGTPLDWQRLREKVEERESDALSLEGRRLQLVNKRTRVLALKAQTKSEWSP